MDDLKDKALCPATALPGMPQEQLRRRSFLKGSGLAAVGAAVLPAVGLMAAPDQAYARNFHNLSDTVGKTLVKMARDIFPHDKLPDNLYAAAIAPYDEKVAKDAQLAALLDKGVLPLPRS